MLLKLAFESDKPFNFQFGQVSVVIRPEPTEVDEKYGKALLQQYPTWFKKVKAKRTVASVAAVI